MMIHAANDAARGLDRNAADFLDRFAETIRAESGVDLPHAYFVEEARRLLAGGARRPSADHHTRPEQFQSSACFDAWAHDDAA